MILRKTHRPWNYFTQTTHVFSHFLLSLCTINTHSVIYAAHATEGRSELSILCVTNCRMFVSSYRTHISNNLTSRMASALNSKSLQSVQMRTRTRNHTFTNFIIENFQPENLCVSEKYSSFCWFRVWLYVLESRSVARSMVANKIFKPVQKKTFYMEKKKLKWIANLTLHHFVWLSSTGMTVRNAI